MYMLKMIVGGIARLLYGVLSGLQGLISFVTGGYVDIFSPQAVWFLLVCLFWLFIYLFFVEVRGWLERRYPGFHLIVKDGVSWGAALLVLSLSVYMGVTTAAAALVPFPIGATLDPSPIIGDAISHGLHDGASRNPGQYGAVTIGAAKVFTIIVTLAQALSSYLFEPDWVLGLLFPKERARYDYEVENVTNNAVLDNVLATTPWWLSFILFFVNILMSAVGAAFMAASAQGPAPMDIVASRVNWGIVILWMLWFAAVWFFNVGVLFFTVRQQVKLNKHRRREARLREQRQIEEEAYQRALEETRDQRERHLEQQRSTRIAQHKETILKEHGIDPKDAKRG